MDTAMECGDNIEDSRAIERGSFKHYNNGDLLLAKIAELERMKETLRQAKDDAMQSWLDSRPVIDELEKTQADLAGAKARVLKSNTVVAELQAQLGTTNICIKSAKEEEQKFRMMINEKNQALHKLQEEMEQLKMRIDQKRRRRSKLKQVLKLKRQTLQSLQLTFEAIQLESEAFGKSAAEALHFIHNSEAANIMVRLTQEEYASLKREAREQTSFAEYQISASLEEKLVAENSRDAAFRKLQRMYSRHGSSLRNRMERTSGTELHTNPGVGSQTNYRHKTFSKSQVKSPTGIMRNGQQQFKKNNSRKKKFSIFIRIKTFFARKVFRYFK